MSDYLTTFLIQEIFWKCYLILLKFFQPYELYKYKPAELLIQNGHEMFILNRIEIKLYQYQPTNQTCFQFGFGTKDYLQNLKILIEETVEYKNLWHLLRRHQNGFLHCRTIINFRSSEVMPNIIRYYKEMWKCTYKKITTTIQSLTNTKKINIKRRVIEGNTMSPKLF